MMTQGIFVYKMNNLQSLVAEEETHDDVPQKKVKVSDKQSFSSDIPVFSSSIFFHSTSIPHEPFFKFCKGFAVKPYTPPDFS